MQKPITHHVEVFYRDINGPCFRLFKITQEEHKRRSAVYVKSPKTLILSLYNGALLAKYRMNCHPYSPDWDLCSVLTTNVHIPIPATILESFKVQESRGVR